MSSADIALQRATVYLEEARDASLDPHARFEALDATRIALIDARRARADPQALLPIFNAILDTASADRSYVVRLIIPQVVEELCLRDFRTFVPTATAHLFRCLQDDHVLVAKRAVRALTVLFRKLMGFVVSIGVGDNFPEARLSVWLQMQSKAVSLITSPDEGIRKAASKLAEAVVLAFSYGGAASAEHFTLDYVAKKQPTSTLLNRKNLEEEGVNCVKAVAELVQNSITGKLINAKPDGTSEQPSLAPATLMTAISVLSTIIRRRAKLLPLTVPPFISIITAIAGPPEERSRAYMNLLESQRASIFAVLRISFTNVRAFTHTHSGPVGVEMTRAEARLVAFEREQEAQRRQQHQAALASQQQQRAAMAAQQRQAIHLPSMPQSNVKVEPSSAVIPGMVPIRDMANQTTMLDRPGDPSRGPIDARPPMPGLPIPGLPMPGPPMPGPPQQSLKRPRPPEPYRPWPRLAPQEAMTVTSELVRNMRPQEVVNFIMTRLLLNIPPAQTVPGAVDLPAISKSSADSAADEPSQKKQKRSRFGAKNLENASQTAPAPKKVAVRKEAPPVVAVSLSSAAAERLMTFCCRRILTREAQINASGAAALRVQLLARILSTIAQKQTEVARDFCDEACTYIVGNPERSLPLAVAWLHSLIIAEEIALLPESPDTAEDMEVDDTETATEKEAQGATTASLKASKKGVEKEEGVKIEVAEKQPKDIVPSKEAEDSGSTDKNEGMVQEEEPGNNPKENGVETKSESPIKDENIVSEQPTEKPTNSNASPSKDSESMDTEQTMKNNASEEGEGNVQKDNGTTVVKTGNDIQVNGSNTDAEDTMDTEVELEDPPEGEALVEGEAYIRVLKKMVTLFVEKPDALELGLSKLLMDAPFLPSPIHTTIVDLCKDPSHIKLGLQLLCDIIAERPGDDRDRCLKSILRLTSDADEVVRGPAIRMLSENVFETTTPEIQDAIEKHSAEFLNSAADALAPNKSPENIAALRRATLLPVALAGHKHEIVYLFKQVFIKSPTEGKRVIIEKAEDLAANIGISSVPLVSMIRGPTSNDGTSLEFVERESESDEDLALALLCSVLKKFSHPEPELVDATLARYEVCKNIEFVLATLPGLNRGQLIKYLHPIVEYVLQEGPTSSKKSSSVTNGNGVKEDAGDGARTARFKEVVGLILRGKEAAVTPAELLIELHKLKNNVTVGLAIRACFELKALYKQEAVAQCLQQLIELGKLPDMLMRTVHLAKIFHPEVENYLTDTVMKRLIEKKVWSNKLLWEGFLRYCAEIKEKSVRLLLSLPVAQLTDALNSKEALRNVFKDLVSNPKNAKRIPLKQRKVIGAALKKRAPGK